MIRPEKIESALRAINFVLVQARRMAFERESYDTIANVLDVAELLPMLLVERADTTEEFRGCLESLVEISPSFGVVLQYFDGELHT